jgi:hypothetical protein
LALLAVPAMAVPPGPVGYDGQPTTTVESLVKIKIDKTITITALGDIELLEKPDRSWEGFTTVTIMTNWPVTVMADIYPYLPGIVQGGNNFDVLIEGDMLGFDGDSHSQIDLHPYHSIGYTCKVWAGIMNPNLLARASNMSAQQVATVYITV